MRPAADARGPAEDRAARYMLRRMVEVLAAVLLFIVGVRVGMWLERRKVKVIDVEPVRRSWWRRLCPCFRRRRRKKNALQRR